MQSNIKKGAGSICLAPSMEERFHSLIRLSFVGSARPRMSMPWKSVTGQEGELSLHCGTLVRLFRALRLDDIRERRLR